MPQVYAIREPAVAGLFYPADAADLTASVDRLTSGPASAAQPRPAALVIPHAGYRYSGAVAARAWALVQGHRWRRVALLGPPHRMPVRGLAAPAVDAMATPLGQLQLDRPALDRLASQGDIEINDAPHDGEHSLEVHLPFIQHLLGQPLLVPLLVGESSPERVAQVLGQLDDGDTLLVISSDLSHFHSDSEAREKDAATLQRLVEGSTTLTGDQACGCRAVNGLNAYAAQRGWPVQEIAYAHSGDASGDLNRVVGYGAVAYFASSHPKSARPGMAG